jgi:hypothetical protein
MSDVVHLKECHIDLCRDDKDDLRADFQKALRCSVDPVNDFSFHDEFDYLGDFLGRYVVKGQGMSMAVFLLRDLDRSFVGQGWNQSLAYQLDEL